MKQPVFLTGITGFVGGWLAKDLLERGHAIVALVNVRHDEWPEKRLAKLFQEWFFSAEEYEALGGRLTVVGGDLAAPRLGISDEVLKSLPPFGSIIHCAGLVQFDHYLLPDLKEINVEGTRNVLALADECGIREFHHVSTAYVAGKRTGRVLEDELQSRKGFHNPYEETKFEAETMVRAWRARDGTRAVIHRPGIVVGDSKTGYTTHYHGFYGLPRAMEICLERFGTMERIRLPALPEKTVNLVPINYVVQAMRTVFESHSHFGETFHLTNPRPPTLGALAEAMRKVYETQGPEFVSLAQFLLKPPSAGERFAVKLLERYAPYLRFPEAEFDQARINAALEGAQVDSPTLSAEQIERLIVEARTPPKAGAGV